MWDTFKGTSGVAKFAARGGKNRRILAHFKFRVFQILCFEALGQLFYASDDYIWSWYDLFEAQKQLLDHLKVPGRVSKSRQNASKLANQSHFDDQIGARSPKPVQNNVFMIWEGSLGLSSHSRMITGACFWLDNRFFQNPPKSANFFHPLPQILLLQMYP